MLLTILAVLVFGIPCVLYILHVSKGRKAYDKRLNEIQQRLAEIEKEKKEESDNSQ